MKAGTHVKLTKRAIGNPEGTRFQPGYWSMGVLDEDIRVGAPIQMRRYCRGRQFEGEPESVQLVGSYESSQVLSIDGGLIHTLNSTWECKVLEPLPVTHSPFTTDPFVL